MQLFLGPYHFHDRRFSTRKVSFARNMASCNPSFVYFSLSGKPVESSFGKLQGKKINFVNNWDEIFNKNFRQSMLQAKMTLKWQPPKS
jgi:hypothetical protein